MATTFTHTFLYEMVTLFVILDPVATVPIFLAATAGLGRKQSLQVAAYAISIAFAVLLFFIVVGHSLLDALHIAMPSFQLAGSIVLLLFGLKMVLGQVTAEAAAIAPETPLLERSIYPLAVPGIAGAGAILTVVLLTDNNVRTFKEQATTTGELVLCMIALFGLYAMSGLVFRLLGRAGIEIITRVFGLIITSIAVNGLVTAIKLSFGLA